MTSLYTIALTLLQPLVLLRLWFKGRAAPAYRARIRERYGFAAPRLQGCIWVHSVSVGETITAAPLIEYLLAQYGQQSSIVVTTTTPTGADRVAAMFGDRVIHRYMPQDLPRSVARFIDRINPQMLIIMETELWPNVIAACHRRGVPSILANGRLSEKSAKSYAKFGALTATMLRQITALCVQTAAERQRFIDLGANAKTCHVIPSLKFEAVVTEQHRDDADALREQWQLARRFVWLAASTHSGEEDIILSAHQRLVQHCADALLILVPRHPERFDSVARLCATRRLDYIRWSNARSPENASVVVVDAMGQLMSLYGIANVAFVGGSLNGGGGHNIMEPALWAKPVLSGPGLFNFQAVSDEMLAAKGLQIVDDERQLADALIRLVDSEAQTDMGAQALAVAERNRGGLAMLISRVEALLNQVQNT